MKYLLITTLLLTSMAAIAQQEQKFHRITDTTDGYSISVPEGWRYLVKPEQGAFEAWRPERASQPDIGLEVATMDILPLSTPLPQIVSMVLSHRKQMLNSEVLDSATVTIGNRQSFIAFTRYTAPEDSTVWQATIVLRKAADNQCFVFTGEGPYNRPLLFSIYKFMGLSILTTAETKALLK